MIELIVIILSISLGSFANTVISHFTGRSDFKLIRSTCFCNEKNLKLHELIPVLSFIYLKGKCQTCNKKISYRYLFVEIMTGLIGIGCFIKFSINASFFIYLLIFTSLLTIGIIDYYSFKIPNKIIAFILLLIILNEFETKTDLQLTFISAISIAALFVLFNFTYKKLKGIDAIGFGDIKLITILTFLLNIPLSFIGIWLSSLIGIFGFILLKNYSYRFKHENRIPFGLFLSMGFIFTIYFDTFFSSQLYIFIGK